MRAQYHQLRIDDGLKHNVVDLRFFLYLQLLNVELVALLEVRHRSDRARLAIFVRAGQLEERYGNTVAEALHARRLNVTHSGRCHGHDLARAVHLGTVN